MNFCALALQRFRLGWLVGLVFQSTYNRPTTSVTGSETEVKAQTEGTEGKKWLVVWNIFYFSIYSEFHNPN